MIGMVLGLCQFFVSDVSVKCLWENKIEKEGHPLLQ